jgi:small subunit ribosomal protein S7
MPRRGAVPKRDVLPDPVYQSDTVSQFINKMLISGKRSTAEENFYGAMDIIKEKTGQDPLEVFEKALSNVMPMLEVKPRRVGGATYQVPVEVRPDRRAALAMRWLIQASRSRSEKTMRERLAAEIMAAAAGEGASVKKREDTHRMAEANKAFAHYRW